MSKPLDWWIRHIKRGRFDQEASNYIGKFDKRKVLELVDKYKWHADINKFPAEERLALDNNKIPLDPRLMRIQFIGKPSKWSLRKDNINRHSGQTYEVDYEKILDTILNLPEGLVIKDEGYKSTIRSLKSYIAAQRRKI